MSQDKKWDALKKIVAKLPAQSAYYASALGAIVLAGGGQLPHGLEFVAGGIGANILSNLIDEIARGDSIDEDEIKAKTENAIATSNIAGELTKTEVLQSYGELLKRLDEQETVHIEILNDLRNGFSIVATAIQVEELKTILVQLTESAKSKPQSSQVLKVFISSTREDLLSYRDAVKNVILDLGMFPIAMEHFNSTDRNALQLCYDEIHNADIFIGIYAHRYGYAPDSDVKFITKDGKECAGNGKIGITHWEYLWAKDRGIPMFFYFLDENHPWQPKYIDEELKGTKLKEFKDEIGKNHVWKSFTTPESLKTVVATGLPKPEPDHGNTTPRNEKDNSNEVKPRRKYTLIISIMAIILLFGAVLILGLTNICPWFNICRLKPFPDEAFVVAVAGFGFDTGESIERNDDSVQMTNTIFSSLEGITEPEYLIGPNQIGYILQPTENERREKAFQLVRDYNIDILVYGVVDTDDTYLTFHPQFAYNTTWASQEPELFLVNEPIELLRYTSNETPTQINERISVINIFLSGLANYIKGNYEQSYELFIDATEINVERVQTSGYIYIFAANAASRAGNYSLALDALDVVLTTDPTNSRALYARGNALLNMAAHEIDYYDPLLDFEGRCLSQFPNPLDRRRVALMAIRCFEEARDSTSANAQLAQIPLRANVSIGQAQMFIASLPGGEFERIETAQQIFSDAIIEFTNLSNQSELNYFGGLAYLGRGDAQRTIICTDDGTISEPEYQRIINDYEIALDLISTSVDRTSDYIKENILYPLENRISVPRSRGCETSNMWE